MPSRVFTREQVLRVLPDDAARREVESIPDFIYWFLRDAFYAINEVGDGYVTYEAVLRCFHSLKPDQAPAKIAFAPRTASTTALPDALSLPNLCPTWLGSKAYLTQGAAAVTSQRPLEFCGFMQAFWPIVSEKVAHLLGRDEWSGQSRGSSSSSTSVTEIREAALPSRRRTSFSPPPFRSLGNSLARDVGLHEADYSSMDSQPICSPAAQQHSCKLSPEHRRLYWDAVRLLWAPINLGVGRPSPKSAGHAAPVSPLPPKRLLADSDVEKLSTAFFYLQKGSSGCVDIDRVAEALRSFLHSASNLSPLDHGGNTNKEVSEGEIRQLAATMLQLASFRLPIEERAVVFPGPAQHSTGESLAVAWEHHITWTKFVRSFQCDLGAFPAELVAWCNSCACATPLSTTPSTLAWTPQWMSPLECALVQQVLMSYMDQMRDDGSESAAKAQGNVNTSANSTSCPEAHSRSFNGQGTVRALCEKHLVNTTSPSRLSRTHSPTVAAFEQEVRHPYCTSETMSVLRRWSRRVRAYSRLRGEGDDASERTVVLPLATLRARLLKDMQALLYCGVSEFSARAQSTFERVVSYHVEAVCAIARRVALLTSHFDDPFVEHFLTREWLGDPKRRRHSREFVDVEKLVNIISADPRCLRLDVLVPFEVRLAAAVDAAQRHPSRIVSDAVSYLSSFVHHQSRSGGNGGLSGLLELRRCLDTLSPQLSRLITGATYFSKGELRLEECLVVLSTQVLSVPPLLPQSSCTPFPLSPAPTFHDVSLVEYKRHCWELLHCGALFDASEGWLRYACRRLAHRECSAFLSCLQASEYDHPFFHAAAGSEMLPLFDASRGMIHKQMAHKIYFAVLPWVRKSCWVCRVDPVVATHVTLVLVVAMNREKGGVAATCKSVDWTLARTLLEEWVGSQLSDDPRCAGVADASVMHAIRSTSAELGLEGCRAGSRALSKLPLSSESTRGVALVEERTLVRVLTNVVDSFSLWFHAALTSVDNDKAVSNAMDSVAAPRARLVDTLVGVCPRRKGRLVDVTLLLQRWLQAYPLPLSLTHLSLCCDIEEVESVYFTLKRLAASEEVQLRHSDSLTAGCTTPSERPTAADRANGAPRCPSPVVTGISPVWLSKLVENDDLLCVLYAVSRSHDVGIWGGALSDLGAVLRPVGLSATGVRISLEKLCGYGARSSTPPVQAVQLPGEQVSSASTASVVFDLESRTDELLSMAVPAFVQHAVSQLFACVDVDSAGTVTEAQLRSHGSLVPASAQYGWHRFVTALCCSARSRCSSAEPYCSSSSTFLAGSISSAVLRSHHWKRRGLQRTVTSGSAEDGVQQAKASPLSSAATPHTDDESSAAFAVEDLVVFVAELRTCAQAHLLLSSRERAAPGTNAAKGKAPNTQVGSATSTEKNEERPAGPKHDRHADDMTTPCWTGSSIASESAEWWATFIEELCRCYSPLKM